MRRSRIRNSASSACEPRPRKHFMKKWIVLLTGLLAAFGAAAQAELDAQRAAMDKLAWMAGVWEGQASMQDREGEKRSFSQETIRRAAGGLAILIQGRHYRHQPDGSR